MRREHLTLRAALSLAITFTMLWGGMPVPALAEVSEEAIEATEVPAADPEDASLGEIEEVGASDSGEEAANAVLEEDSAEVDEVDVEALDAEEEAAIEEDAPEAAEEGGADVAEPADDVVLEAQSAIVDDPRVVADSSMQAGQRTTWDCVWLGSYPQAVVTDAATVAALDAATGWSASGDLSYGGATYRRLKESDATYSYTSSCYWDWGRASASGYCYFLWEPVKWRVLEADGSTALVVADVGLDDQRYNATDTDVTWETCDLRAWLNGTFRDDALTPAQRGAVVPQTLANASSIDYGTPGGNPTTDQVFLLAESDVWSADGAARHGFAKAGGTYDEARRCKPSDYAHAMGAWTSTPSPYLGNCWWWLRSPGYYASYAAHVGNDGDLDRFGYYVVRGDIAVRPALRISLSSNQISYAGTVCSNGTVNEQAAPYSGTPGGGVDSHDIARAQVSSISVQTHTGNPIEPEFTVRMGRSTLLRKGTDYTVSYANNVEVGTATVTITGTGDYHGSITRKFKIRSEADGLLGDLDLSAGFGALKLDVDESVPIVGGDSFSLDLPVDLPAQVVLEDGKIKFGYNLPDPYLKGSHSSAQPQKAWEWTTDRKPMKQQWESFCKDVRKSGGMLKSYLSDKGSFLSKISDGRWKRWNVPGMQKGVQIYASLYGEYAYGDKLTDAASIEGSLVVVAKGTISLEKQWVVWIIPVTVNCDFTASATASASIGYDVANSEWYGDLDLALAIGVEPYAGVGVGKWASVGVYGSAEMGVDMKVLSRREANGLREWYLAGEAGGRAYFAQQAFTWTIISTADLRGGSLGKYVDSSGHLRLWSKTQASVIAGSKGGALGTQSEGDAADEAEELLATAETVPLEAQSTLQTASTDGSLVMESYPGAEPAVVDAGGTRLLVYVGQDPSRAELDRTVLCYRVYDAGSDSWGDPVPVLDDGTADCMPKVLSDGGEAYVAWLDADRVFGGGAEVGPEEYLPAFSARVARWDASAGEFEDLGRPAGTDAPYAYLLALGAGPTLTWAENADDAAFGIGSDATSVCQASWDGTSWSTPAALASGLNAVTSLTASGADAAWAVDEDNDIATPGQAVGSTSGALPSAEVASLAYTELPGISGTSLAAAIDGGLCYYDGTAWTEVLPAGTMGAASDFCVDGDSVYYVRADKDSSHVSVATYEGGEWGTAHVTTDDGYVSSLSCPCGAVALTHTAATPVEGTSEWQTTSEVRVLPTTQRADVALDGVDYASDDLVPGDALPVTLHVTNEGTSRATAVRWSASLDGAEVASGTGAIDLMPGASGSFEAEVPLPVDLGAGALSFRAWCDGDEDDADATVEEAVVRPDLEVTAEFFEAVPGQGGAEGSGATLSVTVRNAGTADANATTTVATEAGGEVLSRAEAIPAGESVTYTEQLGDATLPADGTEVVLVARASCDAEEFYESNNVDYVTASGRFVNSEGTVVDQNGDPIPDPNPDPDPDPDPVPSPAPKTNISAATVTAPGQTYTGRALRPAPTVKLGGMTLAAGTDYSVSYKNNTNAGTATVIVTGRGDYTGTVTCTFSIARAKVSVPKATNRTYNGKAQTGVAAGAGYTLSGAPSATNAGAYAATATPDANHCWADGTTAAKALKWSIAKASSSIKLADQAKTYTGKAIAYSGKVTRSGSAGKVTYKYYSDAKCAKAVKAADVKGAGTYYVRATLAADANHKAATSKVAKLTVKKAAQPMKLKAVKRTAKASKLKKKAVTVAAPLKFTKKAQGKVTYAKVSKGSAKCLTVNKKTGKVTVKRGTKKGTYKIKIKVKAKGNKNYKAGSKTITCKVVVK